jgi:hypothetical protein
MHARQAELHSQFLIYFKESPQYISRSSQMVLPLDIFGFVFCLVLLSFCFLLYSAVLEIEPRALNSVTGKCFTSEPHPQPAFLLSCSDTKVWNRSAARVPCLHRKLGKNPLATTNAPITATPDCHVSADFWCQSDSCVGAYTQSQPEASVC